MGAVFGVFCGIFFWSSFIFTESLNDEWGKIFFISFFTAVNITFIPMHFLGVAGMPRRISNYPSIFFKWNYVATFGSVYSGISLFTFFLAFKTGDSS
jgi:heme/copper-type cytochrome/quinol oxidase subunit 1